MSKFTEYVGSQFGNPRGFIGTLSCVIMNIMNRAMYRRTIALLQIDSKGNMLDIGYGNGHFIKLAYKKYHPNIYGIDISKDMKNTAEQRNSKAKAEGKLHLTVGNCCELQYEDGFFDAVTSINTIYFWDDTLKGLQEIYRTLKPGGTFYNVVYTKEFLQKLPYTRTGFKFFTPDDYRRMGEQAGFSEISVREISKGKNFVVIYKNVFRI